jgi:hypothetical protein
MPRIHGYPGTAPSGFPASAPDPASCPFLSLL